MNVNTIFISQALAKKCIAAFARELETSDSPIVRNNVIVIMCDLCIRYTSLVDRYGNPYPAEFRRSLTLSIPKWAMWRIVSGILASSFAARLCCS